MLFIDYYPIFRIRYNTDFDFIASYSIKVPILKFIIGVDDLQKESNFICKIMNLFLNTKDLFHFVCH